MSKEELMISRHTQLMSIKFLSLKKECVDLKSTTKPGSSYQDLISYNSYHLDVQAIVNQRMSSLSLSVCKFLLS